MGAVLALGLVGMSLAGVAGAPPAAAAACPEAVGSPFSDVPADHPFCREIAVALGHGVVTGYDDGTFRPGEPVTRQAVAAMLYRAATADHPGATPDPCVVPPFPDVPVDHPFCGHIRAVATAGIFNGYDDGTFRPGNEISRQALAAALVRFPDGPGAFIGCEAPMPFVDVPVGHPFCEEILLLWLAGVSEGYPDGTFRPGDPVTRQAFVAMLVRWIEVIDD